MASSADLFALVHSLSASEKRYVRRFAALSGRDSNWLKLFDAIAASTVYNEAAVRKRLQNEPMLANFSVAKGYVYANVMRALRLYGTGRDIDSELSDYAESYKILNAKGLHTHAAKVLQQLRAKAYENDAYLKVMWSIICEFGAGVHSTEQAAIDHLAHFLTQQKETLAAIENYSLVGGIYFRQRIVLRRRQHARTNEERAELTRIVSPLLETPPPTYLSNTAFTFAHLTLGDYWEAMGEPFKAQEHFDKFLSASVLDQPIGPFDSLNLAKFTNAMFFRLRHGMVGGLGELLEELHKRIGKLSQTRSPNTVQVWRYERWLAFSVMYLNAQHKEAEALALLKQQHKTREWLAPYMSKKILLQLQIATMRSHFGAGEVRSAQRLATKMVKEEDPAAAEVAMAHIALLVALYELEELDQLDKQLRRAQYHFSTRNHFHNSEQALVGGMSRLVRCTTSKQQAAVRKELHAALTEVFKDPSERAILGAVDLLAWCEAA